MAAKRDFLLFPNFTSAAFFISFRAQLFPKFTYRTSPNWSSIRFVLASVYPIFTPTCWGALGKSRLNLCLICTQKGSRVPPSKTVLTVPTTTPSALLPLPLPPCPKHYSQDASAGDYLAAWKEFKISIMHLNFGALFPVWQTSPYLGKQQGTDRKQCFSSLNAGCGGVRIMINDTKFEDSDLS